MAISLIFAAGWIAAAILAARDPRAGERWMSAYALMAAGIPILGLMVLELGPLAGLGGLCAGVWTMRAEIVGARWLRATA